MERFHGRIPDDTRRPVSQNSMYNKVAAVVSLSVILFTSCDLINRTAIDDHDPDFDFAVIETSQQKEETVITYYDSSFEKTGSDVFPYGGMAGRFNNVIVDRDHMYALPEGLDDGKGTAKILDLDLRTGILKEAEQNEVFSGYKGYDFDGRHIAYVTNLNGDTYLGTYDIRTGRERYIKEPGSVMFKVFSFGGRLYGFGERQEDEIQEGYPEWKIFVYDKDTLKMLECVDTKETYTPEFADFHHGKIYMPVINGMKLEKEDISRVRLFIYDTATGELSQRLLPEEMETCGNAISYGDKIYISEGDPVTGRGKDIAVYDPSGDFFRILSLEHDLSQIVIKDDQLYAIDIDHENDRAMMYKYQIKDEGLERIGSKQVDTKEDSKGPDFYVGGFFVR